jgi:23S rRNA (cytosine1962-C5)-methyltransferase
VTTDSRGTPSLVSRRPRLAVRVTRDAERQIRSGHPWVFDRSITSINPSVAGGAQAGDLAVVFDSKRRFLAIGLFDPSSPIRVRVLHQGEPAVIDQAWWRRQVAAARDRRRELVTDAGTTAYRVVHGENDQLPGLVVDRYDDTAVVKLYSAAWVPHLSELVDVVRDLLDPGAIVLRLARSVQRVGDVRDGTALHGPLPAGPVRYLENALRFEADVIAGQKTGAFLDQRENRARVRELAAGRRVLDVYACTGGFSLHAAAGGATSVCSVDVSPGAIETTRRNMAANADLPEVAACRHATITGDAMVEMARLARSGERFDLVIVDPPSFASRQDRVSGALRAYERLAQLAVRLVEPGGRVVLASCSSRVSAADHAEAVHRGAARGGAVLADAVTTGHPVDHPIGFPEGVYLKAVFASVEPLRGRGSPGRTGSR